MIHYRKITQRRQHLMIVLLVVEITDVIFATDSIYLSVLRHLRHGIAGGQARHGKT